MGATLLLSLIVLSPLAAACILIAAGLCRLARRTGLLSAEQKSWVERKRVWIPAAAFLGVYILCFAYGSLIEVDWVARTDHEIPVSRPVLGRPRFRIVQLSDLHLEQVGHREQRVMDLVREAKPDLILMTGDYLNVREGAPALDEMLVALGKIAPVYGVPGNWDAKFRVREAFAHAGATLLVDDTTLLEEGGGRLRLVGQDDSPKKSLRELLSGLTDGAPTIFLHHKPDAVDDLQALDPGQRVDLFLCGHTHGGQVRLPFWGAVITMSKHHKRFESGLYEVGGVPMYVNRGVGCEGGSAPRVRFLCRPEVAVFDLVKK